MSQDSSTSLKLNMGANINPREGFINVDLLSPQDDLILASGKKPSDYEWRQSDVSDLSWLGPETVSEISADFILEHLHIKDVPDCLFEWQRVLIKGGIITARVPDAEYYARKIL